MFAAGIVVWLLVGWLSASRAAAMSYSASQRNRCCYGDPRYGQGTATFWYVAAIFGGPLSALPVLADRQVRTHVPGLAEAERKAQAERIKALEADIDRFHKSTGIGGWEK